MRRHTRITVASKSWKKRLKAWKRRLKPALILALCLVSALSQQTTGQGCSTPNAAHAMAVSDLSLGTVRNSYT